MTSIFGDTVGTKGDHTYEVCSTGPGTELSAQYLAPNIIIKGMTQPHFWSAEASEKDDSVLRRVMPWSFLCWL